MERTMNQQCFRPNSIKTEGCSDDDGRNSLLGPQFSANLTKMAPVKFNKDSKPEHFCTIVYYQKGNNGQSHKFYQNIQQPLKRNLDKKTPISYIQQHCTGSRTTTVLAKKAKLYPTHHNYRQYDINKTVR